MKEGDVVLAELPQFSDFKIRPALVLKIMAPFDDVLLCGISKQGQSEVQSLDEWINASESDFTQSGLKTSSLVRLGFLVVLPRNRIIGKVGLVSSERHRRLLERLSSYSLT